MANITAILVTGLRGSPCRVLSSDQRIAVRDAEAYVYADATVFCGGLHLQPGTSAASHPFATTCSCLSTCLVSSTIRRESDGSWHYEVAEAGERLTLSNGVILSVDEVFSGVMDLAAEER